MEIGQEIQVNQTFRHTLEQLRAGGLKHDRRGSEGQTLDALPSRAQEFLVRIDGDGDYRLSLGLRNEIVDGERTSNLLFFCQLEHILRHKKNAPFRNWVELHKLVGKGLSLWRVRAGDHFESYKLSHPFARLIFSSDRCAIPIGDFGAAIHEARVDRLLAAMASLFERNKL